MLLWLEIALPFSSVLISLWNALLRYSLMIAISPFCSRFISTIGPSLFASRFFAGFSNFSLYFMMSAIILLIFFHKDVFPKGSMMFTRDDTRLTFKEHFTSTSVSLTIWTSFFSGQVCSGSHKNCGAVTQVEHFPLDFTSIKPRDAWSAGLSLLGTCLHWWTSLFSWIYWTLLATNILNFFSVFLIYPSTTLLSDQNVSCRQPIFNSFLKNFTIFTENVAATNSTCGIEIYFFGIITLYCSIRVDHSEKVNLTLSFLWGIREVVNPKLLYLLKPSWFTTSGFFISIQDV